MSDSYRPRAILGLAFAAYALFVVYGSLVPLEFRHLPLDQALESFREIRYLDLGLRSRADWVANLLLFIPLSFLGVGLFWAPGRSVRNVSVSVAVAIGCAGLSIAIEFTQLYFPQRTVSINDILAEALGGLIGVLAWWAIGPRVTGWCAERLKRAEGQGPLQLGLVAYLFLLFAYNLLPLDLTLSPVELFHKWKEGRIYLVPFGYAFGSPESAIYGLGADVLAWIPAGLIACFATPLARRTIWLRLVGAAVVLEFLQLWVYSRVSDVTDVLTAAIGSAIGIAIAVRLSTRGREQRPGSMDTSWPLWGSLVVGWLGVLAVVFWYPFDFLTDRSAIRDNLAGFFRVPFSTYYFTSEYQAITQVFRRIAFFAPLGVILGLPAGRVRGRPGRLLLIASAAFAVVCALTFELGQVALRGKVADVTDWILESFGALAGLAAVVWVLRRRAADRPGFGDGPEAAPRSVAVDDAPGRRTGPPAGRPSDRRISAVILGVGMIGAALAFLALSRVPAVPYNVRELVRSEHPILSAVLFSGFLYWSFAMPVWYARRLMRRVRGRHAIPLAVALHGTVAYVLLRFSVPLESIHDIVGSPTFGVFPELEQWIRFDALFVVVSIALLIGALLVRALGRRRWSRSIRVALGWAVALGTIAYLVVVVGAGTDNLVELMSGGGSVFGALCLGGWWMLLAFSGSLVGAPFRRPFRHVGKVAAVVVPVSVVVGYLLASLGTEAHLAKYGQTSSALQFLLSPGRDQLVSGVGLAGRYVVAHLGMVVGIGLLQVPMWGRSTHQHRGRRVRRTQSPGGSARESPHGPPDAARNVLGDEPKRPGSPLRGTDRRSTSTSGKSTKIPKQR